MVARYSEHTAPVRQATLNRCKDRYVSIDSNSMHCWMLAGEAQQARMVNILRYPRGTTNFVTCITYSDTAKLIFCACLDGNLRIYKNSLQLKSVLSWDQTVVYDMHFLCTTNEIIATGVHGVKVSPSQAHVLSFDLEMPVQMSPRRSPSCNACRFTAQNQTMTPMPAA
jgi:hypothetical protein